MQTAKDYLHIFLAMGDALLNSGAEIFRVVDTLIRMGYACGATHMNVFVITSSIVITMEFPGDGARTQTRRIHEGGGNDFTKLEQLNDLSRRFCSHPVSAAELRNEFEKINANRPKPLWKLLGSVLAASSFALFYGLFYARPGSRCTVGCRFTACGLRRRATRASGGIVAFVDFLPLFPA